ncbi:hypothetical protein PUN28_008442 [Cardiocondyla obscurior]|uniref:Uncharacterized protein n=1 Tax=Cardiocondyla obscurior TaxID=286306 RepID=A0AAW2G049_9HYME
MERKGRDSHCTFPQNHGCSRKSYFARNIEVTEPRKDPNVKNPQKRSRQNDRVRLHKRESGVNMRKNSNANLFRVWRARGWTQNARPCVSHTRASGEEVPRNLRHACT